MTNPPVKLISSNLVESLIGVIDTAIELTNADFGNIQLLDPNKHLRIVAHRGFPDWWIEYWNSVSPGNGACGSALAQTERIIIEDVAQSPIFAGTPALDIQLKAGIKAVQSTPVRGKSGQVIGMLSTHYRTPYRPNAKTLKVIDLLAVHAAKLIEHSQSEQVLVKYQNLLAEAQKIGHMGCFEYIVASGETVWSEEEYGIYGLDPTGPSPTFEELLAHCIHPDDVDLLRQASQQMLDENIIYELEHRIVLPDGSIRWVKNCAHPYFNDNGTLERYVGITHDITEIKLREQALQQINHRIGLAQKAAHAGLWDWDILSNKLYWSIELIELFGLSTDVQASFETWRSVVHPDDVVDAERHIHDAIKEQRSLSNQYRIILPNGCERWIDAIGETFYAADGRPLRMTGICIDVTTRKSAEEELKLAGLVYQNSSEAMMITDEHNRIVAINPAFTETTGYSTDEALGRNPKILSSGIQTQAFYEAMWQSVNATGRWKGEIWNRRKNGEIYPEWLSINTIYAADGSVQRRVALFSDITDRKRSEEMIWRQANFDPLTELPNRIYFGRLLETEIKRAERELKKLALMFIDLDRFKEVNDTLGHPVGDRLLQLASERMKACLRDTDILARLGGDEFVIVLSELTTATDAERVAECLVKCQRQPYPLGNSQLHTSISVGIALYPDDAQDATVLLKQADQAMYAAKQHGRNGFRFFTAKMQAISDQHRWLAEMLHIALEQQQFEVNYQPIVDLVSGQIHKAEALIRWNHPERGYISPAKFIHVAEDTQQIQAIGDWVFDQAMQQVERWRQLFHPLFQVSVNKSPIQLANESTGNNHWISHLRASQLSGNCLVVEITEGVLMESQSHALDKLLAMRDAGIQVAIDDFGTGYSSLSYLKKFDIDYLKIDQSFTRNLTSDDSDLALCEAIVVMAHKLGLKVIAEGVETEQQRDMLKSMGCDYGQGYLFSKPIPADEFEKLLSSRNGSGVEIN